MLARTILDRMNHCFYLDLLHDKNLLEESFLAKPKDLSDTFQNTFPGAVVHASREMRSHIGDLRRGAFVHATQGMLLQMEYFLDVQGPLDRRTFFA